MKMTERLRANAWPIAVIVLSVIAHTWQLGRRAMAHDEAIDAWFSWQARGTGIIKYDPVYHGPLRFYLEGFVLDHFGITPGWTRAIAALAGIGATIVIAFSRRLLGRFGAPFAALLFTISPTILTVTRTGREDSLTGLVSLALLLVIANGLNEPRPRHIVGAGALLAVSFTLKETTFIFGLAGACFFVGLAAVALIRPTGQARSFFQRLRRVGTLPWMWSTIVFIAILMVVFTSAFRYGAGFTAGLVDGVKYWWSQHDVGRGSQRSFFYGTIYVGYEWLLLGVAAIGAVVTVRRRSVVGAWFATMAIVQFAVYSWAGEKFAWLALHPLIPAVLLAGLGAQAVFDRLQQPHESVALKRRLLAGSTALLALLTAVAAVRPAITDGADPRELLVTVQTSDSVPDLTDRMAAARDRGTLGPILIDERDGGSWPWAWYLHGFGDVGYQTIDPAQPLPEGFDAYIVSASTDPPAIPNGYVIERFPLRGWWLPDYGKVNVVDVLRWLTTRDTWSPTASSDQYLIVKASAGVAEDEDATG
ncbi:MAG TPA: flippase activity-associated protein Agl23 [Ilumatobacteraceae bacterium]